MNHDGNKKGRLDSVSQQFVGRYKSQRPSSLPTDFRSFVGTDRKSVSVPPAGLFGHERCGGTLRNRG